MSTRRRALPYRFETIYASSGCEVPVSLLFSDWRALLLASFRTRKQLDGTEVAGRHGCVRALVETLQRQTGRERSSRKNSSICSLPLCSILAPQ